MTWMPVTYFHLNICGRLIRRRQRQNVYLSHLCDKGRMIIKMRTSSNIKQKLKIQRAQMKDEIKIVGNVTEAVGKSAVIAYKRKPVTKNGQYNR